MLQKFPKDRTKEDIDVIYPYAKHIKLFNQQVQDVAMSEESIKIICEQMQFKLHHRDDVVFYYGDKGALFYVILQGDVDVLIPSENKIQMPSQVKIEKKLSRRMTKRLTGAKGAEDFAKGNKPVLKRQNMIDLDN